MPLHAVSHHPGQLTLDLDPSLVDRFPTLLDCIRAQVYGARQPLKTIAADCDMSASELSRKISGNPEDPRRFSVEDLEAYVKGTGDVTPIQYLAAKYLQPDEVRQAHLLSEAARLLPQLAQVLVGLKGAA